MNTQPLNPARIAVVATFALACFGLMLYLWNAFGGGVPLKPKGYRVTVALPEADLLSTQADVRISGVSVGKVIGTTKTSATDPNRKDAILEIQAQYAPLRQDVRAMIRRKSLAGEEYLQLTPGTPTAPTIPDGGRLANAQVAPSVEIDEVLRTFDPATRRNFEEWFQQQAASITGHGADLNAAFGNLPGFEEDLTRVLNTLNQQQAAVQLAVRNTGEVFDALSARRDALRGAIVNGKQATDAFAQQSQAFADTWRALPTFERESIKLLNRVERFRKKANPVLTALRPGFREFGRTAQELPATAKPLDALSRGLGPLTTAGQRGLPATRAFLQRFRPFTAEWVPFLQEFNPFLGYLSPNIDSLNYLVANLVALTTGTTPGYGASDKPIHYIRAELSMGPEMLSLFDRALSTSRMNPYPSNAKITPGSPTYGVFDDRNCGPLTWPKLGPADPAAKVPQKLIDEIRRFALNDEQPTAPPCLLDHPASGGGRFAHVQSLSQTAGGGGAG